MGLDILLIQPASKILPKTVFGTLNPLWPGILAALTPDEHNVEFVHCGFEKISEDRIQNYDLIAISSLTQTAPEAYAIGDICRRLNIPCIIGGIHASMLFEEAKQHCNSVVIGEAEYIWKNILEDATQNNLQPYYRGGLAEAHDIPSPDRKILRKYNTVAEVIEFMRGCPHNCEFCSATLFSGRKYRYKSIDGITKEIESLKKRFIYIASTNLIANFEKAKEVFKAIKPYNLTWMGDADLNIANEDELLKLASDSGCLSLELGFESISKATLLSMGKTQNLDKDYKRIVKKLHDYNITVIGTFIFGWDTDDKDVFKTTVAFIDQIEIDFPLFIILMPFPGTRIYERLKAQDRILTNDWSRYNGADVVFEPKMMTKEELLDGTIYAWEKTASSLKLAYKTFSRCYWRNIIYRTLMNIPYKVLSNAAVKYCKKVMQS